MQKKERNSQQVNEHSDGDGSKIKDLIIKKLFLKIGISNKVSLDVFFDTFFKGIEGF